MSSSVRLYQRGKKGIYWIDYYHHGQRVQQSLKTTDPEVAEREKLLLQLKLDDPTKSYSALLTAPWISSGNSMSHG